MGLIGYTIRIELIGTYVKGNALYNIKTVDFEYLCN